MLKSSEGRLRINSTLFSEHPTKVFQQQIGNTSSHLYKLLLLICTLCLQEELNGRLQEQVNHFGVDLSKFGPQLSQALSVLVYCRKSISEHYAVYQEDLVKLLLLDHPVYDFKALRKLEIGGLIGVEYLVNHVVCLVENKAMLCIFDNNLLIGPAVS